MLAAFLAIALHQPGAEAKDVEGKGETSMSAFVSVYSGLFHNQEKHAADPNTPFASKYHIPIHNDFLCPSSASGTVEEMVASAKKRCFYVHEKTNRAGAMQYRLRVAVISIKEGVSAGDDVFTAVHYQFADQVRHRQHFSRYLFTIASRRWVRIMGAEPDTAAGIPRGTHRGGVCAPRLGNGRVAALCCRGRSGRLPETARCDSCSTVVKQVPNRGMIWSVTRRQCSDDDRPN